MVAMSGDYEAALTVVTMVVQRVDQWESLLGDSTVVWTAKLRNGTIRADGRHGEHFTDGRAGSYEEAYRLGEAEYARFKALNA